MSVTELSIKKTELELVQKAFWAIPSHGDYHDMVTIHGETRGKALAKLYRNLGDGDNFIDFAKNYRLKREHHSDLFAYLDDNSTLLPGNVRDLVLCSIQNPNSSIPGLWVPKKASLYLSEELEFLNKFEFLVYIGEVSNLPYYQFTEKGLKLRAAVFSKVKPRSKDEIEGMLENVDFDMKEGVPLSYIKAINKCYNVDLFSELGGEDCYIYSGEWGMWWREEGLGYSRKKKNAGVYTLKDAREYSEHCGTEKYIYYKFKE